MARQFATGLLSFLAGLSACFAVEQDAIVAAHYADPVDRYGHFAAGRPHEYGRIEARITSGAQLGYALPPTEVFEDVAPRLVKLAAGEPTRLLTVISHHRHGASLALLGVERGRLTVLARSAPIGTAMRWLNPVAAADLDGDGVAEIAAVITPHLGGTLAIFHRSGNRLEEVATLGGFSNHLYGSPELGLSMAFKHGTRTALAVPDVTRRFLRIVEYGSGRLRETARCALAAPITGPIVALANGEIEVTLQNARQRIKPADCRP